MHRLTDSLSHKLTHGRTDPNTELAPFIDGSGDIKKIFSTREGSYYSDVLPLKAARCDSISNLTSFGASNLGCRQTQCRFIFQRRYPMSIIITFHSEDIRH